MSFFVIVISFGYCLTLLCLSMPALRYKASSLSRKRTHHQHHFSIIMVYRNEKHSLPSLLQSIKNQIYDPAHFEILCVNDASTDGSLELIKAFSNAHPQLNFRWLDRVPDSNSAKKDGITQALELALYSHILVTDADCTLPRTWISSFSKHYQNHAHALLVAGPVQLTGSGLIPAVQKLEMIALQTITCGAFAIRQPFMCNGANLSFTKDAFHQVGGYSGNESISSGDDVFLLEKLAAEDVIQCHYLKSPEAIVSTPSKKSWGALIKQRARWARKGQHTKSLLNKLVAFQVAAMSILFIISPFLWVMGAIPTRGLIIIYLLKFFTDFVILVISNQLFEMKNWSGYFLINFLIYPFLIIAIGVASFRKLKWHGRIIDQQSQ